MASPFAQAVFQSMRRLYPESLADKSFDNTGLLLEAPYQPHIRKRANTVLLTVDLTRAVAEEAIENDHSVVVAYHPIIFRGLKALTHADPQQSTLLCLAAEGISVYSPHTAVDAVPGGMADWLCDVVTGNLDEPEPETHTARTPSPTSELDVTTSEENSAASTEPTTPAGELSDPFISPTPKEKVRKPSSSISHRRYTRPNYPIPRPFARTPLHPHAVDHERRVVHPSSQAALDSANSQISIQEYSTSNTGAGRLVTFSDPQPLTHLIERIARGVGQPKGFPVAIPQRSTVESHSQIKTVAVCPGSGASVLRDIDPPADLVFTGEMSHHDALAVTERGGCVVTLFHSNSERGYLWSVMRDRLQREVERQWNSASTLRDQAPGAKADDNNRVIVQISERDRDPYGIVILEDTEVEGVKL